MIGQSLKHNIIERIDNIQYIENRRVYQMQLKWQSQNDKMPKFSSVVFVPEYIFYPVSLFQLKVEEKNKHQENQHSLDKKKPLILETTNNNSYILLSNLSRQNFLQPLNNTLNHQTNSKDSQNINVKVEAQNYQKTILNQNIPSNIANIETAQQLLMDQNIKQEQHQPIDLLDYDVCYKEKQFYRNYLIQRNQKFIKLNFERKDMSRKNKKIKGK